MTPLSFYFNWILPDPKSGNLKYSYLRTDSYVSGSDGDLVILASDLLSFIYLTIYLFVCLRQALTQPTIGLQFTM